MSIKYIRTKHEIWRDIPDYENLYQISNLGNLKSLLFKKPKILKPQKSVYDYYIAGLYKNGKQKKFFIHKLVASAFLKGYVNDINIVGNHKNFNRLDNNVKNIELITQRDNTNKKHIVHSSKYTGVSKFKNKWVSVILIKGKQTYLGSFKTELEASQYYENALYNHNNGIPIKIKVPTFTSKFKGVRLDKARNKWIAEIIINKKSKFLGRFSSEIQASKVYQNAKKSHIEFIH